MGSKPNWSEPEKRYLSDSWGNVSIDTICKNLNRSRNAINIMKQRLKLGAFLDSGEYITVNQFFVAFGYVSKDSYAKISWVKNRGFPLVTKKVCNCRFEIIYLDKFWEWADKNRHFVPFERLEKNIFGVEPEWVDKIRKIKQKTAVLFKKTPWTKHEDERLKFLLKQHKHGYYELSRLLMRTEGAILKRCIDLKLKERPVREPPHNLWTVQEKSLVYDLLKQGYTYELISEKLPGRSVKAIKGIVYKFAGTENIDKVYELLRWEVD